MPARSVRMKISNATEFTLKKVSSKLCGGILTDPFTLPETIGPGESPIWEAESGGDIPILGSIGTGTEGWVKYTMVGRPNVAGNGDFILFYWDNPFVGNTFFGFKTSRENLKPSENFGTTCDDDSPSATIGSSFPPEPSQFAFFPLHFALDGTGAGPPKVIGVTEGDVGDEEIGRILPLPGQNRLFEHAWFEIGIFDNKSASMRRVFQAMKVDSSRGVRRSLALGVSLNVRDLLRV